ncbi:nitroreductase/quinone reductase family protein [Nocardia acidivorans]|uniref:nitroreductase/quinone reductase family protein n=1 Tax=Nocardia acidivorans TaxID=404580 RepID=UPI000833F153|nr:nitroreductase/quinone reductase family protein [Nocardia acidivorans]
MQILLLTTTGAHTGQPRAWPLGFHRDGDTLAAFAANGNRPGWYYNLRAHPDAVIEVGTETWPVPPPSPTAHTASGPKYPLPFLADFPAKVPSEIPVIALPRTTN